MGSGAEARPMGSGPEEKGSPRFSGSYEPSDVIFLLKPVELSPTPVEEKERLIQSGQRHYSEVLAPERPPDASYLELFDDAFVKNGRRLAQDLAGVVKALAERAQRGLVLISFARAGTPVGVLMRRGLGMLGIEVPHYSISIVRDRGLDARALDTIRSVHPGVSWCFVDGWTGKGAIRRELDRAFDAYARDRGIVERPFLAVLADLAGVADLAAHGDDYLIPSAILNAVVSGLISRTVLNPSVVGPGDYHACVYYAHLHGHDRSRWFVDAVASLLRAELPSAKACVWSDQHRAERRQTSQSFMTWALEDLAVDDRNRLKPGIGEATRALLRRVPERVMLREPEGADVVHILHLAQEKNVPVEVWPLMPYRAATLIRRLGSRHRVWR